MLGALDAFIGSSHYEDDPGDDLLIGGGGDDDLRGGAGADDASGNAGRDSVGGGEGDDRLRGGPGPDRFYNDEAEAERVDFTPGIDELRGPPVPFAAVDDTYPFEAGANGGRLDVLANDTRDEHDPSDVPLAITALSDPLYGRALVSAVPLPGGGQRPAISYFGFGDFPGVDTFTYTVTDGRGRTDTATVTVGRVAPGGCPPGAPTDPYVLALEHTVPQIMH